MMVELHVPREVMAALVTDTDTERGPSEFSVALDVVNAVSSTISVAQLLKAAPEFARRVRAWVQSDSVRHGDEHLVIKGPGVSVELDLPPNVSSQKIVDALTEALRDERSNQEPPI